MSLESITGNLKEAYAQIEPGTMQHADQITAERRTDEQLQNQWFYTADGPLYFIGKDKEITADGTPHLALTREPHNLVLRNLEDAFAQLLTGGNYRPNRDEAQAAIKADTTLVVDLTKLRLKGDESEWYLEIGTSKKQYAQLNPEERMLAERYFGAEDFEQNMNMLNKFGIKTARIHALNPEYVAKEASKNPLSPASWLDDFGNYSYAGADGRVVDGLGRVRGVRRIVEAPEGRAPVSSEASEEVPEAALLSTNGSTGNPSLDGILAAVLAESKPFIAEAVQKPYEAAMRKLFEK